MTKAFTQPGRSQQNPKERAKKDEEDRVRAFHEMRERLTETQLDKIDQDSFPASDPPGRY